MLKVIYHTLPIEKVHGGPQEVPVETLGKSQASSAAGDIGNGDDLLEGDNLDGGDDDDDVNVAREHCPKETSNHDEGPDGAGDEGLLFLLIL